MWGLLVAVSLVRVPVPGVNEPHYLAKARAFWQPEWCAGDLFLESSTPHRAFYVLMGWMTLGLSLETVAIIGRIAALALLAWGWKRLVAPLGLAGVSACEALLMLLLLHVGGSWSGEWLVGGVESKVFAYGFAFAGLGACLESRWRQAGVWLGLACTLHPLVGGWCTLAAAAGVAGAGLRSGVPGAPGESGDLLTPTEKHSAAALPAKHGVGAVFVGLLLWGLAAAPGAWWAWPAIGAADPKQALLADYMQIAVRLPHHLDPLTFPRNDHRYALLLLLVWGLLRELSRRRGREDSPLRASDNSAYGGWRRFEAIVVAAIVFAMAGVLIAWGPRPWAWPAEGLNAWRLRLLKFYPFRLADILVPVAVAMTSARMLQQRRRGQFAGAPGAGDAPAGIFGGLPRRGLIVIGELLVLAAVLALPGPDHSPSGLKPAAFAEWRAALEWIREKTPDDTLIYSPNEDFAIKWFAERPEYVNWKDAPQDAAGLTVWNQRLNRVSAWTQDAFADGRCSQDELVELRRRTGIGCLICLRLGPIEAPPSYQNGTVRVYVVEAAAGPGDRVRARAE